MAAPKRQWQNARGIVHALHEDRIVARVGIRAVFDKDRVRSSRWKHYVVHLKGGARAAAEGIAIVVEGYSGSGVVVEIYHRLEGATGYAKRKTDNIRSLCTRL